jgi:hypothetical protein
VSSAIVVDDAVAVVVHTVAALVRGGEDRRVPVVTVPGRPCPAGIGAGLDHLRAPPVTVRVEGEERPNLGLFVDLPVTVLVHPVAQLEHAWVDEGVDVVAIPADLREARVGGSARHPKAASVAVPVEVEVPARRVHRAVVHCAVAVLVHAVAALGCVGVYVRARVVAIVRPSHPRPRRDRRRAAVRRRRRAGGAGSC